jgi:hypothetical protein
MRNRRKDTDDREMIENNDRKSMKRCCFYRVALVSLAFLRRYRPSTQESSV